jgi:hypothetical protein
MTCKECAEKRSWPNLRYHPSVSDRMRKTMKITNQDIQCMDLNRALPEDNSKALSIETTCSATTFMYKSEITRSKLTSVPEVVLFIRRIKVLNTFTWPMVEVIFLNIHTNFYWELYAVTEGELLNASTKFINRPKNKQIYYKECGQRSQHEDQHFKGHMAIINFIDKSDASRSGTENSERRVVT